VSSTFRVQAVPAALPHDEAQRLSELYAYDTLDTDPEESFDDIAMLASQLFGAPIALVNLIDSNRSWSKAAIGAESGESVPREHAFCPHTIVSDDGTMVIEDALADPRFARNPFVLGDEGIRFYAGSSIRTPTGHRVGTVCVVDTQPRTVRGDQVEALRALSRLAVLQLELRRLLTQERRLVQDLRDLDRQKAEFTSIVAHDFRSPLTSIRGYAELLRENAVPAETALDSIERGAEQLLRLVDELTGTATELAHDQLDLAELARAAVACARPAAHANRVTLSLRLESALILGDAHRLAQALDNLVGNAVKYAPGGHVTIKVHRSGTTVVLEIVDTGVGVPEGEIARLFDRFFRASTSSRFAGTGVGLSVVKAVVEAHGGAIAVTSTVGKGTTFRVELPAGY
jgi:signal transduction histidine kinase